MVRFFPKLLMLSFLFVPLCLTGAEEDVGILVRGPVKEIGFPLIYPNAMETWSGIYSYLKSRVFVSFTREDIFIPSEWNVQTCDKLEGFSPDGGSFLYKEKSWSVVIRFSSGPAGTFSPEILKVDQCIFIDKFLTRLKYFLRDDNPLEPPLFPAILEF